MSRPKLIVSVILTGLVLAFLSTFISVPRSFTYSRHNCQNTAPVCLEVLEKIQAKSTLYGFPFVSREVLVIPPEPLSDYSESEVSGAALLVFRPIGDIHVTALFAKDVMYPLGIFLNWCIYSGILFGIFAILQRLRGTRAHNRH